MLKLFTAHPHKVGESYFQHLCIAMRFSFQLFFLAVILFIHALFPFLLETKGSDKVLNLADDMNSRRNKYE